MCIIGALDPGSEGARPAAMINTGIRLRSDAPATRPSGSRPASTVTSAGMPAAPICAGSGDGPTAGLGLGARRPRARRPSDHRLRLPRESLLFSDDLVPVPTPACPALHAPGRLRTRPPLVQLYPGSITSR